MPQKSLGDQDWFPLTKGPAAVLYHTYVSRGIQAFECSCFRDTTVEAKACIVPVPHDS